MAMSDYPNREHENADKAARRRALAALTGMITTANMLSQRLEAGQVPYASDVRSLTELAGRATEHVSALETLRDVREWHAADQTERDLSNGGEANE